MYWYTGSGYIKGIKRITGERISVKYFKWHGVKFNFLRGLLNSLNGVLL